jgi:hypothetical protein
MNGANIPALPNTSMPALALTIISSIWASPRCVGESVPKPIFGLAPLSNSKIRYQIYSIQTLEAWCLLRNWYGGRCILHHLHEWYALRQHDSVLQRYGLKRPTIWAIGASTDIYIGWTITMMSLKADDIKAVGVMVCLRIIRKLRHLVMWFTARCNFCCRGHSGSCLKWIS